EVCRRGAGCRGDRPSARFRGAKLIAHREVRWAGFSVWQLYIVAFSNSALREERTDDTDDKSNYARTVGGDHGRSRSLHLDFAWPRASTADLQVRPGHAVIGIAGSLRLRSGQGCAMGRR